MGARWRECQNKEYDGRDHAIWAFGQEFDSPHLHGNNPRISNNLLEIRGLLSLREESLELITMNLTTNRVFLEYSENNKVCKNNL